MLPEDGENLASRGVSLLAVQVGTDLSQVCLPATRLRKESEGVF